MVIKKSVITVFLFVLLSAAFTGAASAKNVLTPNGNDTVDMILKNGAVYTGTDKNQPAKTVAVRNGEIVYVGNNNSVMSLKGPDTKIVDLQGKMVLPGFIDSHNHAYLKAEELYWLNLTPYSTIEEYGQAMQDYVEQHPDIEQLRAVGWNETMVKEEADKQGVLPKELIDQYVEDLPVVAISNGHHDLWVNSKALEIAEVDKDTPDPQGGIIERTESGEPTGVLHEFSAQNLIINALPQPDFTLEEYKEAITAFQEMAAERGVTSVFVPVHYPTEPYLQALQELDDADKLTVQYDIGLWADETKGVEQVETFNEMRDTYDGDMFTIDSIKIFGDGDGTLVWEQDMLEETVAALDKEDFRVYVHAFGDGIDAALDAFAYAAEQNGTRDARHALTHIPYLSEDQLQRFQDLNITAVPQPGSRWGTDIMQSYIGMDIPVASSSDYPVSDFWPLVGVEGGMTRPDADEQASLEDMLQSYTINGAEALFIEDETGSIEVGKRADFVILEKNLFDVPADKISDTKTVMTISNGKIVYTNPAFD
ncbi:hypothetical protein SAMN05192534_1038 [Alteribacillus persepolensis]|uniref:Amidohydrolase 3 domain-containing protein n=1 Tax=Alteribacillus persepolensis TaxID=568899 RepID=A0A1G8AT60_9BACI|nr:amidohydrolase [Alteribacillus persepolensis]SDH24127.1 hypothetical protein SAMN05192534_1038 [Alteribacillus persepolensis]